MSIKTLNDQSFYELPEEDFGLEKAIQLLINNTLGKNGTVIRCIDTGLASTIAETTLIVDGKLKNNEHMVILAFKFIIIISSM